MDNKTEKQIQEFERLERIARRIVTKNKVAWSDFLLGMFSLIVSISMSGYTSDTQECKEALKLILKRVLYEIDEYYGK